MRIAGGTYRGRVLKTPDGLDVRPTQDRVREAMFNILMHDVAGARFLDLFAGSGAVGLEAMSRGARSVTSVEANRRHISFIEANAAALGAAIQVVRGDAYAYVEGYSGEPFDIAFADPPYAIGEATGFGTLIGNLSCRNVVRPGGLFIAETTLRSELPNVAGWDLCRDREYGKSRLIVWKRRDGAVEA